MSDLSEHPKLVPFSERITRLIDGIQAISKESPDLAAFLLHTLQIDQGTDSIRFQIRLYHDIRCMTNETDTPVPIPA